MNISQRFLYCSIASIGLLASIGIATTQADTASTFKTKIQPLLASHCTKCHGEKEAEADVKLTSLKLDPHLWYRVLDQLEFGEMPPKDEKALADADRKTMVTWIRGELTESLAAKQRTEGRSRFRRLSRAEYASMFEDLFGIRPNVALLPEDGRVAGFTKVSQALPMSMDGAYGYYQVARELLEKWVLRPLPDPEKNPRDARKHRLAAMESGQSAGHTLVLPDRWYVSFNTDDTSGRLIFGKGGKWGPSNHFNGARVPGLHKVRAHIYAYQSDKPLTVGIYAGHTAAYPQQIELVQILEAPPGKPAVVETEAYLGGHGSGVNRLRLIPFGLGVQVPKNTQASKCKGPGLAIQWVEVIEPERPILAERFLTADFPDDLREAMRRGRLYIRDQGAYRYRSMSKEEFVALMRKTFTRVGARVLRRDITKGELDAICATVQSQLDEEVLLKKIFFDQVVDLLSSPEFFCVFESPGELADMPLASRLSYFLWNSAPDEQLLSVARQGKLRDAEVLRREVDRLLDDPRSERFVEDFLSQWLDLHAIDDTRPDGKLYPEYGDDLKFSSLLETRGTFARILKENRSVRDFAAPGWVLANGRLSEHYGLNSIKGAELKTVRLPADSPFGGLWTQPAILKVTADGSSTSPVKRGVWIAKRLLGTHVSPPPPNIEPINPDTSGATTVREQLALHSADGSCASCHKKFDPYGFALESFDVMGQFRTKYRVLNEQLKSLPGHQRQGKQLWLDGLKVDASGITPEGERFSNIVGLRKHLAERPEKLAWGVTWHLATYATGEPSGPLDRKEIQKIVDGAKKDDYGLRSLVHGLVQSKLFRWK